MKPKTLIARIEKHRAGLIKHRDAMRDLIQKATALESDADYAQESLGEAIKCIDSAVDYISGNV